VPNTLAFRLTVIDPASPTFTPGDATVDEGHFSVTSLRAHDKPYIAAPPEIDGMEHDLLTGKASDGAATVRVIDEHVPGGALVVEENFNQYRDPPASPAFASFWQAEEGGTPHGGVVNASGVAGTQGWRIQATGGADGIDAPTTWGENPRVNVRTWGVADGLAPDTQYRVRFEMDIGQSTDSDIGHFPAPHTFTAGIEAGDGARVLVAVIDQIDGGGGTPNREDAGIPGDVTVYDFNFIGVPDNRVATNIPGVASFVTYEFLTTTDGSGDLTLKIGKFDGRNFLSDIRIDNIQILEVGRPAGRVVTRELTDDDARPRLMGRQAVLEESEDLGTTWATIMHGYVQDVEFVSGIEAVFTLGDTRRIERGTVAWKTTTASFPLATPLIGGPVEGGWDPIVQDVGLPVFIVRQVIPPDSLTRGRVLLQYQSGPLPPRYLAGMNVEVWRYVNQRARQYFTQAGFFDGVGIGLYPDRFPRLTVTLGDAGDGTPSPATFDPLEIGLQSPQQIPTQYPTEEILTPAGELEILWDANQPSVNDVFTLTLTAKDISEDNPLHLRGHPVDIIADLHTDAGVPIDSATQASVKAALGDLLVLGRITTPGPSIQDEAERWGAWFGFGLRIGADGEREFFQTRNDPAGTSPSETIDVTVLREANGPMWKHSENSICNTLRWEAQRYAPWVENVDPDPRPTDGVRVSPETIVSDFSLDGGQTLESATDGVKEQSYRIPGMMFFGNASPRPLTDHAFSDSQRIFQRFGKGAPFGLRITRRGTVGTLNLGDLLEDDTDFAPTALLGRSPTSQRGGSRWARVVQRTWQPGGHVFRLIDAGDGTPVATGPTFTLALDPTAPGADRIRITIDAAASLIGAGEGIRFEIGFGVSEPTSGALLASFLPGDLSAIGSPYQVHYGPYTLGETVWVRAQAFLPGGAAGAWSAWQDVTIGGLSAPTSLSSTSTGPTSELLTWTNTETEPVEVQIKLDTAASYTQAGPPLPAGSDRFELTGLIPSTAYDVRIRYNRLHLTPPGASAYATHSFTSSSGSTTLLAPINPIAYRGLDRSSAGLPVLIDGRCGLIVTAQSVPSDLVFEVAVETAVGSATPGSYTEFARIPANPPFTTTQAGLFAANDGKLRYFRAKSTRAGSGLTDSPYSSPIVSIDPWGATTTTPGTNGSAGTPPAPVLSFTIDGSGNVTVYASVGATVTSVKFAAGSIGGGVPSDATVRAGTTDSSAPFEAASLVTLAPGEAVIVAAYAYDAQGNESAKGTRTVQRDGGTINDVMIFAAGNIVRLANGNPLYTR
jgi:hypothetical protein